jgi:hypothetical protein
MMVVIILVGALLLWFALARLFKWIGGGAQKLIEPLKEASKEDMDNGNKI